MKPFLEKWYYICESTFKIKEFRSKLDTKTIADFENKNILNIELVIETYTPYIYTMLKNCLSNQEDIEEILSDVFMVLWKNHPQINNDIKIKPYLVGITKNLIRKKYRYLKIKKIEIENIENYENIISNYIDVENLMETNEKSKIILNTLDNMKEEKKQIFMMFYYKSQKIKEISKQLNISQGKIKTVLHRTRKLIKKKLKERGYGYGK